MTLSLVSKQVKEDYDDKLDAANLYWHDDLPITSFFGLARRHPNLRSLEICSEHLLPSFGASIGRGQLDLLKKLILPAEIPLNCLSTLAGLIAVGALPLLESFEMCKWQETGATAAIMRGFQAGGCPLLRELMVPFPTFADEDGREIDHEHTE